VEAQDDGVLILICAYSYYAPQVGDGDGHRK